MNHDKLKDYAKGFRMAVGFAISLAVIAFTGVFAAASWGALPNAGTTLSSAAWNDIVSQLNTLTSAISINSGNVSLATGKTLSTGKLQITDTVTVGAACSPDGTVAKDSS